MEKSFFRFVWRHSKREQLFILALTIISFPLVYISLEIPKMIVNDAIDGRDFPRVILGVEFGQIAYLMLLCGAFLGMVVAINGVKWVMNIAVGVTGERMLRRLRFLLFEQVMRFRMRRFRSTKPGEVVQAIMAEIEPLGGFIGEVIATPAFQGGLLCVYVTFIFMQDWALGLAAVSLYPVQAWLIPKMQKRVIRLNKERAANNRSLADTVAESVGQIAEIHTNDTARWHLAQVSGGLFRNTLIRIQIYRRKFTIKFLNNFLNQLTPFFFYSIGGYLVIQGDLDFGALVAVLAAYKDLAGPWRELLGYVQRWNDFDGRYAFVVENFMGEDVEAPERIWDETGRAAPLSGELVFDHVEGGPGSGGLSASGVAIPQGMAVAVTGGQDGARDALLCMAAALSEPQSGSVRLGGRVLVDATLAQIGRSVACLTAEPGIVNRTIRDNLVYGLLARAAPLGDGPEHGQMRREAEATGNLPADPDGDWIDYRAAGVDGPEELERRLFALIERFGLDGELVSSALEGRVSAAEASRWTGPVLAARARLERSGEEGVRSDMLELWDPERLNTNATLLENLLFSLPAASDGDIADLVGHPEVATLLVATEGEAVLEETGLLIASEFAELVETVDRESGVLDGFPGYPRAEVLAAADLARAHRGERLGAMGAEARRTLRRLAARFVPTRDRLDVLDEAMRARVLECRRKALARIDGREDFVRFDERRYNPALSIAENIVGAKRRFDRKARWRQLDDEINSAIRGAGLREELLRLGLRAPVGPGGGNLTAPARRRIAVVRAILKRPSLIVLNGIGGGTSAAEADLRAALREEAPDATLLWAADDVEATHGADRILDIGPDGTARMTAPAPAPAREREWQSVGGAE